MTTAKENKKLSSLELSIRTVKPRSTVTETSEAEKARVVVVTVY